MQEKEAWMQCVYFSDSVKIWEQVAMMELILALTTVYIFLLFSLIIIVHRYGGILECIMPVKYDVINCVYCSDEGEFVYSHLNAK